MVKARVRTRTAAPPNTKLIALIGTTGRDDAPEKSNVRFAEDVQNLRPEPTDDAGPRDLKQAQQEAELEEMTPEAREEIRRLAMSQQKSRLQEQRAGHFAYDTFSLPASRVRYTSCWKLSIYR